MNDLATSSLASQTLNQFLTNSVHYPLANAGLAVLLHWQLGHVIAVEAAIMLGAGVLQATLHGLWISFSNPYRQFLENLVGPTMFSLAVITMSGINEFAAYQNYLAYWYFSILFGILRSAQLCTTGLFREMFSLIEAVSRISIFLVVYWIFEAFLDSKYLSLSGFLSDPAHVYLAIVIPLLGLILGILNIMRIRADERVARAADRLRTLSEWSWGEALVRAGVSDPDFLVPQSKRRVILFADIRGFTSWSETHTSLEVADMLEEFYSSAERVWSMHPYVFVKHTADEVLVVYENSQEAVNSALKIRDQVRAKLDSIGLSIGIGINMGQVTEGALGSINRKNYDVVGAAVNIASRICGVAGPSEILISESVLHKLNTNIAIGERRSIAVKGKSEELTVFPLVDIESGPADES